MEQRAKRIAIEKRILLLYIPYAPCPTRSAFSHLQNFIEFERYWVKVYFFHISR